MTATELVKAANPTDLSRQPTVTPLGDHGDCSGEWDYPPSTSVAGEVDVAGNRDLGDLNTWALIMLMCAVAAFIVSIAYLLPHGQEAAVPPIKLY